MCVCGEGKGSYKESRGLVTGDAVIGRGCLGPRGNESRGRRLAPSSALAQRWNQSRAASQPHRAHGEEKAWGLRGPRGKDMAGLSSQEPRPRPSSRTPQRLAGGHLLKHKSHL